MLLRGALVGLDPFNPVASINVFQYNPHTLTRSLTPSGPPSGQGAREDRLRLWGAPKETISLEIEIDAVDRLETGEATAAAVGVHPQIAALEMLLYPKSAVVLANAALMAVGAIEVVPAEQPLTLFVWGAARVLPVQVQQFRITETAYDSVLNPIRCTASLELQVLTYDDLPVGHPGYAIFLAHQVAKEAMAVIHGVGALADAATLAVG